MSASMSQTPPAVLASPRVLPVSLASPASTSAALAASTPPPFHAIQIRSATLAPRVPSSTSVGRPYLTRLVQTITTASSAVMVPLRNILASVHQVGGVNLAKALSVRALQAAASTVTGIALQNGVTAAVSELPDGVLIASNAALSLLAAYVISDVVHSLLDQAHMDERHPFCAKAMSVIVPVVTAAVVASPLMHGGLPEIVAATVAQLGNIGFQMGRAAFCTATNGGVVKLAVQTSSGEEDHGAVARAAVFAVAPAVIVQGLSPFIQNGKDAKQTESQCATPLGDDGSATISLATANDALTNGMSSILPELAMLLTSKNSPARPLTLIPENGVAEPADDGRPMTSTAALLQKARQAAENTATNSLLVQLAHTVVDLCWKLGAQWCVPPASFGGRLLQALGAIPDVFNGPLGGRLNDSLNAVRKRYRHPEVVVSPSSALALSARPVARPAPKPPEVVPPAALTPARPSAQLAAANGYPLSYLPADTPSPPNANRSVSEASMASQASMQGFAVFATLPNDGPVAHNGRLPLPVPDAIPV